MVGGCLVVYALYRLVAFDEQTPARPIGFFSGAMAGLALAAWVELRDEWRAIGGNRRRPRAATRGRRLRRNATGAAGDAAGFLIDLPPSSKWGRRAAYAAATAGLVFLFGLILETVT